MKLYTSELQTAKLIELGFEKLYIELRESVDCNDLDVFIHLNSYGKVVVNLDIQ